MISCGITKHLIYSLIAVLLSAFINGINHSVRESALKSIFRFTIRVKEMRVSDESLTTNPQKDLKNTTLLFNDNQNDSLFLNFIYLWSSSYTIAVIVGALLSWYSADRLGRKLSLLWTNCLVFLAIFFISFSARFGSYEMVFIGQFLIGVNTGMNTCLATIYMTEVSPIRIRGIFGSAYYMGTSLAILTTYTTISILELENWIYMFSSVIIPSILMIIILNECPESPKFSYIIKGDQIRAQNALQRLRENSEINEDLYEMKVELQAIERNHRFRLYHLWSDSKIRNALFISMIVIMAKYMTGINAIQFFTEHIYERAGIPYKRFSYLSIFLLVITFKTSLIFMFFVEKFGRRTLLLVGLLGMFGALVFLEFCLAQKNDLKVLGNLSLITLILFLILHSCGPSFIPLFFFTELFRTDCRSVGASISIIFLYLLQFSLSIFIPHFQVIFGGFVFAFFATITLILWIIIYKKVPETKGKTIEEIIFEL